MPLKDLGLQPQVKVKSYQSGKRHGMIKRTNNQIRNQRGSTILSDQDARIVKKFLPYG